MTDSTYKEYNEQGNITAEWDYSAEPWTVFTYDEHGAIVDSRPFTPEEVAIAQHRLEDAQRFATLQELTGQLMAGVTDIQNAIDAAQNDVAVAGDLKTQADSIKAAATAQRQQVAAFSFNATYSQSQMNTALKPQLDQILARQEVFAQAFADGFVYRQNVDSFMVKAYNAILWLARVVSGRLQG